MRFLKSTFCSLMSLFGVNRTHKLRFKGHLPPVLQGILDNVATFERVCPSNQFQNCLHPGKRNAAVLLWCHGEPQGFLCEADDSSKSPAYLPESWWEDCPAYHNIYLFAYACHSSTYLLSTNIVDFFINCIGFRDELWFCLASESAKAFWLEFVRRLNDLFQHAHIIDFEFHDRVEQLYKSYLRECRDKPKDKGDGLWLNIAFLNFHLENLVFIEEGRLCKTTQKS